MKVKGESEDEVDSDIKGISNVNGDSDGVETVMCTCVTYINNDTIAR